MVDCTYICPLIIHHTITIVFRFNLQKLKIVFFLTIYTKNKIKSSSNITTILNKAKHLFIYSFMLIFILDHQHNKFCTVKGIRESRKGRRRKTSNIKAIKKKVWKSKNKTLRSMAASPKEQKRKGEKNQIKNNFIIFYTSRYIQAI